MPGGTIAADFSKWTQIIIETYADPKGR